jgi:hypothetical protein
MGCCGDPHDYSELEDYDEYERIMAEYLAARDKAESKEVPDS